MSTAVNVFDFVDDEESLSSIELNPHDAEEVRLITHSTSQVKNKHRNGFGFWLLGLYNNFAYVVMLSGAHDILSMTDDTAMSTGDRDCNTLSTGTILLADILPGLFVKFLAPFIWFNVNMRIGSSCVLTSMAFLLVGLGNTSLPVKFLGVACASMSAGLGEATLLAYTTRFDKHVVSCWSSGTGAAGILGSGAYMGLILLGVSPQNTMLAMLFVPLGMALTFWVLIVHPKEHLDATSDDPVISLRIKLTFTAKLKLIQSLLHYMVPLFLVYMAEYLINQGLFELMYFPDTIMSHSEQYRAYSLVYSVGVFISRSSVSFYQIKRIGLLAILQWLNFVICLMGSIYVSMWSPITAVLIVFLEGLLGGAAYVNTFYRITNEVDHAVKDFAMQVCSLSDTIGIAIAGFLAIPIHNTICGLSLQSPGKHLA